MLSLSFSCMLLSLPLPLAGNRIRQLPDLTALSCLVELNLRRNAISTLTDGNPSFPVTAPLPCCLLLELGMGNWP